MKILFFAILSFIICPKVNAQEGFQFISEKDKIKIPFQFINNLIFIPLNVNGVDLIFLLDTGVEETILFSLDENEEIKFKNTEKIKLRGLGNSEFIEGLKSSYNKVSFQNKITDFKHDIYIILDEEFNFSSSVGIPVNGIIGYHFFKNFMVDINYITKKITLYNPTKNIKTSKLNKFSSHDITIENSKPYLGSTFVIDSVNSTGKLLLDVGNSDALWLFDTRIDSSLTSKSSIDDFLGKGFNGDIFGKRVRMNSFAMEHYQFKNPYVAFPDIESLRSVKWVENRIGSIGSEIFKRFQIIFDYKNKRMYLKKNSNFSKPFGFNMSGIEISHVGLQWVQEVQPLRTTLLKTDENNSYKGGEDSFKYKFVLKPIYLIAHIRKDSPADLCGLKKNDIIVSINKQGTENITLQQVNDLFKSKEGKKINVVVDRGNRRLDFSFYLKNIL